MIDNMKLSEYKSHIENEAKYKNLAQQSKIEGYIIIFDLTGSASLKQNKPFPNWIEDYIPFYNLVVEPFNKKGITWYKFLGDAFLFFIPSVDNPNYPDCLNHIPVVDVIDLCRKVMDEYWDKYKIYNEREYKGARKHINFRELTCAIDYGDEIINWIQLLSDNKNLFDPVGKTVDRCFRLSSYAGAGHLLVTKDFFNKLILCESAEKKCFHRIRIKEGSLKGFDSECIVYYNIPDSEKQQYYIDDKNVSLIEDSKEMEVKVKLKLMREKIKYLEGRK